jgi:hypothetical protein
MFQHPKPCWECFERSKLQFTVDWLGLLFFGCVDSETAPHPLQVTDLAQFEHCAVDHKSSAFDVLDWSIVVVHVNDLKIDTMRVQCPVNNFAVFVGVHSFGGDLKRTSFFEYKARAVKVAFKQFGRVVNVDGES